MVSKKVWEMAFSMKLGDFLLLNKRIFGRSGLSSRKLLMFAEERISISGFGRYGAVLSISVFISSTSPLYNERRRYKLDVEGRNGQWRINSECGIFGWINCPTKCAFHIAVDIENTENSLILICKLFVFAC
jgi:hypothetical protein